MFRSYKVYAQSDPYKHLVLANTLYDPGIYPKRYERKKSNKKDMNAVLIHKLEGVVICAKKMLWYRDI